MVMTRMLDLDKMEAQWLVKIEKQYHKIEQCDMVIQEQQAKKQEASEEIEKYNRFIHTAREMYGLNTSDLKDKLQVPDQKAVTSNGSVKGLKMPAAIKKILSSDPTKSFTVAEITTLLKEKGFESPSPHFRNIVFNTLHRMTDKDIMADKKEFKNKYRIIIKDALESLLK
jgi:hypothetical protein